MPSFPTFAQLVGHPFEDIDGNGLHHRQWMANVGEVLSVDPTTSIMLVNGPPVTGPGNLPFAKATWAESTDLLDLTDPTAPRVLEAGIYAFNLTGQATGGIVTDEFGWLGFDADGPGNDHYQDVTFAFNRDPSVQGGNTSVAVSLVGWVPAGGLLQFEVRHVTADVTWIVQGTIQKVASVQSHIDGSLFDAEYAGPGVNIPANTSGFLQCNELGSGNALLDMTDPEAPTVVTAGVYAATACITIAEPITAGSDIAVVMHLDATDQDFIGVATISHGPDLGSNEFTIPCIGYIPAGGVIKWSVMNTSPDDHVIELTELALQRIINTAAGAGPPGETGATGADGPAGPPGSGSSGGSWLPYRSGQWYPMPGPGGDGESGVRDRLYAVPYYVRYDTTFAEVGIVNNAIGNVRLGVYAEGGGVPGTLIVDAGHLVGGGFGSCTLNRLLTEGWYWIACVIQDDDAGQVGFTVAGNYLQLPSAPFAEGQTMAYSQDGISGALPGTWGSTFNHEYYGPLVWLKTS